MIGKGVNCTLSTSRFDVINASFTFTTPLPWIFSALVLTPRKFASVAASTGADGPIAPLEMDAWAFPSGAGTKSDGATESFPIVFQPVRSGKSSNPPFTGGTRVTGG